MVYLISGVDSVFLTVFLIRTNLVNMLQIFSNCLMLCFVANIIFKPFKELLGYRSQQSFSQSPQPDGIAIDDCDKSVCLCPTEATFGFLQSIGIVRQTICNGGNNFRNAFPHTFFCQNFGNKHMLLLLGYINNTQIF